MRLHPITFAAAALTAALAFDAPSTDALPPAGFTIEPWPGDWEEIVGIEAVGDGRFVAWERGGMAWMVGPDGLASEEPLLDIGEEVSAWQDHGMLGLALDPDFLDNGYLYILYVVDRHHLVFHGTDDYDPEANWFQAATIGRITRYTATAESDRSSTDPSSRRILVGSTIDTGLPILNQSHGVGSLAFGDDGTLLCSMGDSASFFGTDTGGSVPGGWVEMALEDGIITPLEDVGSYRAQLLDSHAGKILRIDPGTGDGVPSNPWYHADAPDSPRSRAWTIGLRNPFRISVTPGTGSTDPAQGDPGEIVYGDVGVGFREELGTVSSPGMNLGWPLYEGLDSSLSFWPTDIEHPQHTNPLAGTDCPERIRFRDLLVEDGEIACNPCHPSWREPSDWSGPTVRQELSGWTGDGHLEFNGTTGEWIEFTLSIPDRRARDYALRYSNGSSTDRPLDLLVDGRWHARLDLPPTGSWNRWHRTRFTLALGPGEHVIRVVSPSASDLRIDRLDAPDLDYTLLDEDVSFHHRRASIDWRHNTSQTRVPIFTEDGSASVAILGTQESPVTGDSFAGNCTAGGVRIDDPRWPEEWNGIFFTDFIYGWLKVMRFGDDTLEDVGTFTNTLGQISQLTQDPASGDLIAIRWQTNPIRITPPKPPPVADLNQDGAVDGQDLGILLAGWGSAGPGDLDGDGTVGGADFGILLSAFTLPSPPCPEDLDGSREVDSADLGYLLILWGEPGPADLDGDGVTGSSDIGLLLAAWGACRD